MRRTEDGALRFQTGSGVEALLHPRAGVPVTEQGGSASRPIVTIASPRLSSASAPRAPSRVAPSLEAEIALACSGASDDGLEPAARNLIVKQLDAAMRATLQDAADPAALRVAMRALRSGKDVDLIAQLRPNSTRYVFQARNAADTVVGSVRALERLLPNERVFLSLSLCDSDAGHALGIEVARLDRDQYRLGIFNSLGWGKVLNGDHSLAAARVCAVYKTVDLQDAADAMRALRGSRFDVPRDHPNEAENWEDPGDGAALLTWLRMAGDPDEALDRRSGVSMAPQKPERADCQVEHAFSWLANVLARADYKRVKAVVMQEYARDAALGNLGPAAQRVLEARASTAWRGVLEAEPGTRLATPAAESKAPHVVGRAVLQRLVRTLRDAGDEATGVVEALERRGAPLHACRDADGRSALHVLLEARDDRRGPQATARLLNLMLQSGLDLDVPDHRGVTPRMLAARRQDLEL